MFGEIDYQLDFDKIDLEAYRDLDQKVKAHSGYASLEVEPFPRMRIMELGLMILEQLRRKIPSHAMYRVYTEEKMKYYMELTHQTPNVMELEARLGEESVEYFIEKLAYELQLVDLMVEFKPWERGDEETHSQQEMLQVLGRPHDEALRYLRAMPEQKTALNE